MIENILTAIFWISLILAVHPWILYPLILRLFTTGIKAGSPSLKGHDCPKVSVVIAAYNAANVMTKKLKNTLRLNYPQEKLEIIVVSDGSRDATVEQARSVPGGNIKVYQLDANRGKSTAQNEGVKHAKGEFIVFTDVDSELEAGFLQNLVPAFDDPRVACVGGLAVHKSQDGVISSSQGFYWKLEQYIRTRESKLGILFSLPGWGFAVRRSEFIPLDPDTGDDMILPMEMALKGKRSLIAERAIVSDTMPSNLQGEMKARQRITLRNLTGIMRRKQLLNPFLYPKMAFAIWSHRLLRWLNPFFLFFMLVSSLVLTILTHSLLFTVIVIGQMAIYCISAIGFIGIKRNIQIPIAGNLASFFLASGGFIMGVLKYAVGVKIKSYSNLGNS